MSGELITLEQIEHTLILIKKAIFSDVKDILVLTIFIGIAVLKRYISALKDKLFHGNIEKNTKLISDSLAMLCGQTGADRALFFIFKGKVKVGNQKLIATATHEAVRAGISSVVSKRENITMIKYGIMLELLLQKEYLIIRDITKEVPNASLKATYRSAGVDSVAKVIVRNQHDQLVGYISLEYVGRSISYDMTKLRATMVKYANIIGNSLGKKLI